MEIVIYIIVLLILTRYAFVLAKYIKTGKFKKNKRGGHLVGIIAYSFLTVLLICILISAILKNTMNRHQYRKIDLGHEHCLEA